MSHKGTSREWHTHLLSYFRCLFFIFAHQLHPPKFPQWLPIYWFGGFFFLFCCKWGISAAGKFPYSLSCSNSFLHSTSPEMLTVVMSEAFSQCAQLCLSSPLLWTACMFPGSPWEGEKAAPRQGENVHLSILPGCRDAHSALSSSVLITHNDASNTAKGQLFIRFSQEDCCFIFLGFLFDWLFLVCSYTSSLGHQVFLLRHAKMTRGEEER